MTKKIFFIFAVIFVTLRVWAFTPPEDESQSYTRENPDIDTSAVIASDKYPEYINLKANHISMNGASDWGTFRQLLDSVYEYPVNIVHIGDSHLQADMGTAVIRNTLAKHFGASRGRGLIIPFRLAGTNQPVDYKINSSSTHIQSRLLKKPWETPMRFTGIGISPVDSVLDYKLLTQEPFDAISIYFSGEMPEITNVISDGRILDFETDFYENAGIITIFLSESVTEAGISLKAGKPVTIHGFNLTEGETGLAYHVIGNNGAAYISYNEVPSFADDIALLEPDLIIISLGCNEAFGNMSDSSFQQSIHTMVSDLRRSNPDAALLLVTPAECQRKVTTTSYRGKRRRRRKVSTTSFAVNRRVGELRQVILDYAAENNIAVYDWYDVAGSSAPWVADMTLNTDRIHHTMAGYQLMGRLMSEALIESLNLSNNK